MNAIQSFTFNNVSVAFRSDGFLHATAIASHFGKSAKDYLKTEQTQQYIYALAENLSNRNKILIEYNQLVIVKGGSSKNGGGTWLHPKLAVDFARWLDPRFAVWCDEQIEQIISGSLKSLPHPTTTAEREPLRNAVNMLVSKKGLNYSDAYKMVHQRFNVGSIEDLAAAQLSEAVEYVHRVLCGEVLDKEPALAPAKAAQLNGDLLLAVSRLLLHAQDMRLFIRRYLPAFECLDIPNHAALWSYVHETEPTFAKVREAVFTAKPEFHQYWSHDDFDFVRRKVAATV